MTKQKNDVFIFFIPCGRPLSLAFLRKRMVGGGDPFYLKFGVK